MTLPVDVSQHVVLYVDDERNNLTVFKYNFDALVQVRTAMSGAEALEVMERERVSVLLTDQRMSGLSGVELCARVLERWPDTARIIVSAYVDGEAAIDAINRGQVHRFIQKPWNREGLLAVLRECLEVQSLRSELGALQRSMAQQERLATLGLVSAGFAHDLRGPVSTILGALEFCGDALAGLAPAVQGRPELAAQVADARGAIADAHQSEEHIRQLLESTRSLGQAPVPQPLDLASQVQRALGLCRAQLDKTADLRFEPLRRPRVLADAGQLAQVVVNLVVNAAQAMEGSGKGRPRIVVRVDEVGGQALLEVEDSGPGIAPEVLPRIFSPYFTTRAARGGTGLGLALVQQAVSSLGGTVTVTSEVGQGARFTVALPRAAS